MSIILNHHVFHQCTVTNQCEEHTETTATETSAQTTSAGRLWFVHVRTHNFYQSEAD